MFFDESRFTLTSYSFHQLLSRKRKTRYAQPHVFERDLYDLGVLLWKGIMHNGRIPLYIFERLNVMLQQYCSRQIIQDHVRLFRNTVGSDFLFMDDNARSHKNAWEHLLQNDYI